ncbi:MAG: malto-oligosyltrehalose trehalohydrolase, partial [Chloroflexia bacterium]|nr:malto-oligosyltrehalose trehalohydrolase [Chloroflexia bacterium]
MNARRWRPRSGANVVEGVVEFAVWAPNARHVDVALYGDDATVSHHLLHPENDGRFVATLAAAGAGSRYRFRLDGEQAYPDPYARFQPEGVHGPSEVIDSAAFAWTDGAWPGISADGLVIYELHVGTMTAAGTFAALTNQLPELKRLGVTAIELMPVAQCPGRWNWGYDGVDLFAPSNTYGRPDEMRRLVDTAHATGLGVILDVVYNHLGPEGNYLSAYADAYFSERHQTGWGAGLNWDGPGSEWVRAFAIDNACHWIAEYHIDGLRLDATHALLDDSTRHIVQDLTERARAVAGGRRIVVVAEDERHDVRRIRPIEGGGEGLDGVWADDFHHEVRVLLTGARENYYADYEGTTTAISRTIDEGFGYQGQVAPTTSEPRGTPITDEPASAFVFCIQNHDQVGNRPFGDRLHHEINAERYAVASALLLFAPEPPLLFMGQEFAASTPFFFFTDHPAALGNLVAEGRRAEFAGFRAFHDDELRQTIPDPQAPATFFASKLRLDERFTNAGIYLLYRTMLALRAEDEVLAMGDRTHTRAAALTAQIVAVHRWWGAEHCL